MLVYDLPDDFVGRHVGREVEKKGNSTSRQNVKSRRRTRKKRRRNLRRDGRTKASKESTEYVYWTFFLGYEFAVERFATAETKNVSLLAE